MTTREEIEARLVRYGALIPCKSAFIDAHTPGSNQKENFTIIGGGVAESPDQHVHIRQTPGFNIGAAGQPPGCRNSLHSHRTAEVFWVLEGRWRFFWGRHGTAGSVILEQGDIFNIPTGMFRGFENIGAEYGMIMAILGGDDAGGGVIWAPEVLDDAEEHGLVLAENGVLYDRLKGQSLPAGISSVARLSEDELATFAEPTVEEVVPHYVARFRDMQALATTKPLKVIGENGLLRDKPGFEVEFVTRCPENNHYYNNSRDEIIMVAKGHWVMSWEEGTVHLAPGDTLAVPPELPRLIKPSRTGEAALFRISATDDSAGPTWVPTTEK